MLDTRSHSQGRAQPHNEWGWGTCSGEKGVGQEGKEEGPGFFLYLVSPYSLIHLTGSYFL